MALQPRTGRAFPGSGGHAVPDRKRVLSNLDESPFITALVEKANITLSDPFTQRLVNALLTAEVSTRELEDSTLGRNWGCLLVEATALMHDRSVHSSEIQQGSNLSREIGRWVNDLTPHQIGGFVAALETPFNQTGYSAGDLKAIMEISQGQATAGTGELK